MKDSIILIVLIVQELYMYGNYFLLRHKVDLVLTLQFKF